MSPDPDRTLTHLLDGLEEAATGDTVSVNDVLDELGNRAITPFILLIAILIVSPLSGIPGVPTLSAVLIITLSVQALFGRRRLWLPSKMLDWQVASPRMQTAISWMRRSCAFLDKHSRARLRFLTVGPMRWATLLVCVVIPMSWPALELLPFVSSFGAGTIALLAFGLLTRDGLYVLAGYFVVTLAVLTLIAVF